MDKDLNQQRKLRVLSLCGGGTRGLVSLVYLKVIEELIHPVKIHSYFDIICGTSTGGLIAVALGLLRWSVQDVKQLYDEFVFPNKVVQASNKLFDGAKAETEQFEEFLKERIGNATLLAFNGDDFPKVFVTSSLSKTEPKLQIFCNFPLSAQLKGRYNYLSEEQLNSLSIIEAVRATTAAPVYFPPVTIGGMNFKDGGLVQNNPSLIALEIVRENWKDRGIDLFISVGTGSTENKLESLKADAECAASTLVLQTLQMATSAEKIHEEVYAHLTTFAPYYKLQFPANYVWLNCAIPSSLSGLAITDPEQLEELQKIAEADVAKQYKALKNLFK